MYPFWRAVWDTRKGVPGLLRSSNPHGLPPLLGRIGWQVFNLLEEPYHG